jgi:hypothetical protein
MWEGTEKGGLRTLFEWQISRRQQSATRRAKLAILEASDVDGIG